MNCSHCGRHSPAKYTICEACGHVLSSSPHEGMRLPLATEWPRHRAKRYTMTCEVLRIEVEQSQSTITDQNKRPWIVLVVLAVPGEPRQVTTVASLEVAKSAAVSLAKVLCLKHDALPPDCLESPQWVEEVAL